MTTGGPDWAEGYVVDMAYVSTFLAGMAPASLAFAALQSGVVPPDIDRPFTYLDVGCGTGFTPALLAAANPHGAFWGNDFLTGHVRAAQATAAAAGIGNATFVESSFEEMAKRALPGFDFVAVNGIWSWISPANRARIVTLLARCVKPGGIVMVGYNCHPGWDALLPLRRLLVAAREGDGTPAQRIARALATARRLHDAGAAYFRDHPVAAKMLADLERADPGYIAHEYLNAHWTLFHPGEVAAEMAGAGLSYVGQARPIDNLDRLVLTAEQRAIVAEAPDAGAAHALHDLILDRRFRRDLFVRDAPAADAAGIAAWLAARRFVLARPRTACPLTLDLPAGEIVLPPEPYGALLDTLATGPATGAMLGAEQGAVAGALGVLVSLGYVQPALAETGEAARCASTARFNAAMLAAARIGEPAPALASPVTGGGVAVTAGEQLLLDAYGMGVPLEAIGGGDDAATARFRERTLPLLERLGIA